LSGHSRSTKRRPYRKAVRAQHEERTRARIVDAAEALHGSIGPARTTISAVAERAGVTRATVYRHFPDEDSLFLACSGQWAARQRVPDPAAWATHDDPLRRLRAGLTDIYRFYRDGEQMLTLVMRDAEAVPRRVREARQRRQREWLTALLARFPDRRRRTLRAAVGHAAAFPTWRSLCVVEGLSDRSAVALMVGMVAAREGADTGT
jgi:AcrR family transcriptional regulator